MLYQLTQIPQKEILKLALGQTLPDPVPPELLTQAQAAAEKILPCCPRYHYCIADTQEMLEHYFPGKDIRRHLSDCQQCILLCATLGPQADTLIRRAQVMDMAKALFLDAAASAAIEEVCDGVQIQLAQELERSLTARFSCGYGDFPLSVQKDFLSLLNPPADVGITVSPGGMLIPVKSVTAVIGILPERALPSKTAKPCSFCPLYKTCILRRKGVFCGKYADR